MSEVNGETFLEQRPSFEDVFELSKPIDFTQVDATIASLDVVYAVSIQGGLHTSETMEHAKAFTIDLDNLHEGSRDKILSETYLKSFGPSSRGQICHTCKSRGCMSHMGLVKFPYLKQSRNKSIKGFEIRDRLMILHPYYVTTIRMILSFVCVQCKRIVIMDNEDVLNKERRETLLNARQDQRLNILKDMVGTNTVCKCSRKVKKGKEDLLCPTHAKYQSIDGRISVNEIPAYAAKKRKNLKKGKEGECEEKKSSNILSANEIYTIFMNIGGTVEDNEDNELLGFTKEHMRGFFKDSMLIIPTVYRQRVGKGKNNPITICIQKIIDACLDYPKASESTNTEKIIFENYARYLDEWNTIIKSKNGLFRGYTRAKRLAYTGRATLVPAESSLAFGYMQVPARAVREGLYVPNRITAENIDYYQDLYYKGKVHEHKKMKGPSSGRWVHVNYNNVNDTSYHFLEIGDEIRVEVSNGDINRRADSILSGRQPTQTKLNMFSARVKVVEDEQYNELEGENYTTSFHFELAGPVGGDFDGDQAHSSAPQLIEALEDMETMYYPNHMRSYQNATSVVAYSHNAVIGFFILSMLPDYFEVESHESEEDIELRLLSTLDENNLEQTYLDPEYREKILGDLKAAYFRPLAERRFHQKFLGKRTPGTYLIKIPSITRNMFNHCASSYIGNSNLKNFRARLAKHKVPMYSGRGLFSSILPHNFFYEGGTKMNKVVIKDGVLISGILTSTTLGTGPGSIMDRMTIFYSELESGVSNAYASATITNGTLMASNFIEEYGFTVDYTDFDFIGARDASERMRKAAQKIRIDILNLKMPENPYEQQEYDKQIMTKADYLKGMANIIDKERIDEYEAQKDLPGNENLIPPAPTYNYEFDEVQYRKKEEEGTLTQYDKNIRFAHNNLVLLSQFGSGAKGKEPNLISIMVTGGTQTIMGSKIPKTVSDGTRVTVMNRAGSASVESIGYVGHSYREGLGVLENHVHSQQGRPSDAATAIASGKLGVIQRDLQLALNCVESYKGGAIMKNIVLEYVYGGDGLDGLHTLQESSFDGKLYMPFDLSGKLASLESKFNL